MCVSPSLDQIENWIKDKTSRIHFVGIGGTGMSAYADFRALSGARTSGSDRGFDLGQNLIQRDGFVARGIEIFPQDGGGVIGATAVVVSAAIEKTVTDYVRALELNIPVITRANWLAAHYRVYPCIAVTGTSGKSTVTAMVFEILRYVDRDPGLITGADLKSLLQDKRPGNAVAGTGPLVMEADESDKGIGDYTPEIGVILNLQRDHDEPENMIPAFNAFKNNCRRACLISDDPALKPVQSGAVIYGETATDPVYFLGDVKLTPEGSEFTFGGQSVSLNIPGRHNVDNAVAALAVGVTCGLTVEEMAPALASYQGLARRFDVISRFKGIDVIDDYAHNPAKIAAVIRTAALRSKRLIVFYQPHGFGPTRFMRPDLVSMFVRELRPIDQLYIAPIYYAGGTAVTDISSRDLVDDILKQGGIAYGLTTRDAFVDQIPHLAESGDAVVIVGGRDPFLPQFARNVAARIQESEL